MKAQPAPVDSGRYFCADLPLLWTKLMPEAEAGISEKGKLELGLSTARKVAGNAAATAQLPRVQRNSRRGRKAFCADMTASLTPGLRILLITSQRLEESRRP